MKNMCSSAKTVITNGPRRCRAASVEWFNFSLLVFFCRLLWPILPRGRSLVCIIISNRGGLWMIWWFSRATSPPPTWQVSYQEAPHRFFRDCTDWWWWGCIFAIHYLVRHRYFNIYHFIISHFPRIMQPPLAIGNAICLCVRWDCCSWESSVVNTLVHQWLSIFSWSFEIVFITFIQAW